MVTILTATNESELRDVDATNAALWIPEADLERTTGWSLKEEGFCRGGVCVPRPAGRELARDGRIDVAAFWKHRGWPAVASDTGDVWSLGEGAGELSARLESLEAPDFALEDLAGRTHRLSDYRGKKVLLVTWASW
jgi:hypothetical protein